MKTKVNLWYLCEFFLEWEMLGTKVVQKINTRIFNFHNCFFPHKNRAGYEIMWKNMAEPGRPHMTRWRTLFACCIHEARNTHSEYVIRIALPVQQWLHERASILRHTYSDCLVLCCVRYNTSIHPISGFGGLEAACWPLVTNFAGSNPAEAVGFFRAKKSSARLPSEGK